MSGFGRHADLRLLTLLLLVMPALQGHARDQNQAGAAESSAPKTGDFDGPAELPRSYLDSSLRATPAPGKILTVHAGEDPSATLAQASCGDTIELQAGATFPSLTLPGKNCDDSHWIIIRTNAPDSKLPPEGTRLTPCYGGVSDLPGRPALQCASTENVLAKIEFTKNGSGPVVFAPGANHYRLIGLEVTRAAAPIVVYNLIGPKGGSGTADHIILDRMWLHGTAHDETVRGVILSRVRYVAIVDSYFSDFHCVARTGSCVDAQAIGGGIGDDPMGPFKIVNNFLEAAGESIIFGGGEGTATPTDIEIRRNHLFKPMTWMKGQPGYVGGNDGGPFVVKNLFELKNAQRVLFDGNILENTWGGFSQAGYAVLLTPKNQAIRMGNVCPSCFVTDVTIRNCHISHVAGGFQIGNGLSGNGGPAKDGGRYSIHDVVVDDIQPDLYNGFGVFAQISMTPGVSVSPRLHDVKIDHVTAFPPKNLFVIGGPVTDPRMYGLTITNNIFTAGIDTLATTGGGIDKNCSAMPQRKSIDGIFHDCFGTYTVRDNVIVGGGGGWPKENKIVKNVADVGFVNYKNGNGGDYRLSPGSKFMHLGANLDAIDQATAGIQ